MSEAVTQGPQGHQELGGQGGPSPGRFRRRGLILRKLPRWEEPFSSSVVPLQQRRQVDPRRVPESR